MTAARAASASRGAPPFPMALVAAAHAAFLISGLSLYLVAPGASTLSSELGLQYWQTGLLLSAANFGYGLVGPFAGLLAARFGASGLLAAAMALHGASALLFSLGGSFEHLVGVRALMGLLAGCVTPVATLWLAQRVPPARLPLALGIGMAGFGLGALILFGLLVPLLGSADWAGQARATAGLSLVACVLVLLGAIAGRRDPGRDATPLRLADLKQLFGSPGVHLVPLYCIALLVPMLSVVAWAPVYLQRGLGLSASLAGVLTGSVAIGMSVAPLISSWLMLRFGPPKVLLYSPIAFVALPALMIVAESEWAVAALVLLSGAVPKLAFTAVLAVLPRLAPLHLTGLAAGYSNLVGFIVSLLPPVIFGRVLDQSGSFQLAFLALAVFAAPGLFFGLLLYRRVEPAGSRR